MSTRQSIWMATALLIACGGGDESLFGAVHLTSGGHLPASNDLPCALANMLAQRCQLCHSDSPKYGAPMPLVTRGDLLSKALDGTRTVASACIDRMTAEAPMPPPPNDPATASEVALLDTWIDDGAPARATGESCPGNPTGSGGSGGAALGCEPDMTIAAASPFEMPAASSDAQICFGIDLAHASEDRHITAIAPIIDNEKILHHMLLFEAPVSVSPEPAPCSFTSPQWKLLYSWGPGTPPYLLPPEAGFPLSKGEPAHFVLQVHYNNALGSTGETDQSGVALCTTSELRPYDADIMVFGGVGFDGIAPNAASVLDCSWAVPLTLNAFYPITIFQSWPHMHALGKAMASRVDHADGTSSPIVDVADYAFGYQATYPSHATLDVGDTVRTSCTWYNSTPNTIGYGENTADEMCFNFVSYYPRIGGAPWNALAPAQTASCALDVR